MLKSWGVVGGGGGGLQHFRVSPRPLGFGFWTKGFGAKGLGPGLENKLSMSNVGNSLTDQFTVQFSKLLSQKNP